MLNCSPGPRPGAPLKSPMQLVPTEPTPDAKLFLLKMLNISARNCSESRSLIGIFLMTDRSTSLKLGPTNLFRDTGPPVQPGSGNPVDGSMAVGLQNAAGFSHCTPGIAELKLCDTPLNGSPIRFSPESVSSYGWPEWKFIMVLTCHPFTKRPSHAEEAQEALGTS